MPSPELKKFIKSLGLHPHAKIKAFVDSILGIESNPKYFITVQDLVLQNAYRYISPVIEKILGYPYSRFMGDEGARFINSLIPRDLMPGVYETQVQGMKQAKEPGFDHIAPQYVEFNSGLIHARGNVLSIKCIYVILDYTPTSELHHCLGVFQDVSLSSPEEVERSVKEIHAMLKRIKEIYIELFPEKFSGFVAPGHALFKLYNPLYVNGLPPLTPKETEVLHGISCGYSTKEIALHQQITFNTVETHRKHLLEKFGAKNTAELIKKASKVYWLE